MKIRNLLSFLFASAVIFSLAMPTCAQAQESSPQKGRTFTSAITEASPKFVLAQGNGLDGTDIDAMERQNQAYERIAKAVTPVTAMITNLNPGAEVTMDTLRDGKPLTIKATLGERPDDLGVRSGAPGKVQEGTLRGIMVQDITPQVHSEGRGASHRLVGSPD
jgi:hypothetical protein